ncbi:hypothetical protein [Microcystis aeruginosa]|uniref:hypothetical protein n=1 Tax=Microcystis aeruginosa TaxID=1126 RepID=UPI0021AB16DF|nr:hypothetical protein [Microcystis sp. M31BS1]
MIIVDTGFWLALANEQDNHHQQAQLVIQRLREPLITTWCVVTETCYLLLTCLGNHAQLLFIQNFLAGGFEVFELQSNRLFWFLCGNEVYTDSLFRQIALKVLPDKHFTIP